MTKTLLSVVICTHNPRPAWIIRVLEALRAQTLPKEHWELIAVDNRSADPLEGRLDVSWQPAGRVIREETLGLTPARLRGIREARGDLLVFVDDDNLLDRDFLEQALRIAEERPWLGAWSGQCRPEFETDPPEWTRRYWGSLVIRSLDRDVWSNIPRLADTMPCGAGLCVRRGVAEEYLRLHDEGVRRFQFDRTGDSLVSGGDNDLAGCACEVGLGVGLVADLKLVHLIPASRLTLEYLMRLTEGIHFSSTLLDKVWGLEPARRGAIGKLADKVRIYREKPPHREMLRAAFRGRDRALAMLEDKTLAGPQ